MRVWGSQKGGEIVVAYSREFGQLVRDIMGADTLHDATEKTGISMSYLQRMRSEGQVPRPDILAQFVAGYHIDEKLAQRLSALTIGDKPQLEPEALLQLACQVAGLTVSARLRVLDCFREALADARSQSAAA